MSAAPNHRSEYTGNPVLDRIQNNVRDVVAAVRSLLTRMTTSERMTGIGCGYVTMANVDYTLSPAQAALGHFSLIGTHSAARTLTVPGATDATAYIRWITNVTSGGFAVTVKSATGGTTVSVANGTTQVVLVRASGAAAIS